MNRLVVCSTLLSGLKGGATGESGVTSDGNDVVVIALEIACGGHAQSCREGGASVPSAIAVVL